MDDVIVIGAGAAGLLVARELRRSGRSVRLFEASDRVGGRICTRRSTSAGLPLELGAEFIHGEALETNRLLAEARLVTVPVLGRSVRADRGRLESQERVWQQMTRVFRHMSADRKRDRSFQEFLADEPGGPRLRQARQLARGFVQGFNAADVARISEKSIALQGDPIEGAIQASRILDGYGALIDHLHVELSDVVHLNHVVQRVAWSAGGVRVQTRAGVEHAARAAVITVPLPFLQDDSLAFEPEVSRIRKAARSLVMGYVTRVSIVVKERFWEKHMNDLSFVHTPTRRYNVWWTLSPLRAPLIVGWSGGPPAFELSQSGAAHEIALDELARAFGMRRHQLDSLIESLHSHDWTHDPCARGAYSYAAVGGAHAASRLAWPVEGRLFFAGEATASKHNGTVEGALASARRAFGQVMHSLA